MSSTTRSTLKAPAAVVDIGIPADTRDSTHLDTVLLALEFVRLRVDEVLGDSEVHANVEVGCANPHPVIPDEREDPIHFHQNSFW